MVSIYAHSRSFEGKLTVDFVADALGEEALLTLQDLSLPRAGLTDVLLLTPQETPFTNLSTVNLDGNMLVTFGGLGYLPHLRTLSLRGNRIRKLFSNGYVPACIFV
jgi:Leucine-rich repeat (LRR) protein